MENPMARAKKAYCDKKSLIKAVARLTESNKTEASRFLNATFFALKSILEEAPADSYIVIRGFGSFHIKELKPIVSNLDKTGIKKSQRMRKVKFKPSYDLKKYLRKYIPPKTDG